MKRWQKRVFGTVAGLAAFAAGVAVLGNELYRGVLSRPAPKQEESDDLPKVSIDSRTGLRLAAYLRQGDENGHRWAICIHGYKSHPRRMSVYGDHYVAQGFSVLLPFLQGHGDSEGAYISMGWEDRLSILDWIDWILERDPQAEIVLHGVSMGAATAMMAAGEPLPKAVGAVIADCGYTTALAEFRHVVRERPHNILLPSLPVLEAVTWRRAGYRLKDASAIDAVSRASVPILFIHGLADDFVPPYMAEALYEAKQNGPRQLYLVPGAGHGQSVIEAPEAYWSLVDAFIKRHRKDPEREE